MTQHEQDIRKLSKEEVIRRITEIYHAGYDLDNPNFDIYDQLLACEAIAESEEKYRERRIANVSVNGNDNATYKREVNFELTKSKLQLIEKLKSFTYKSPPIEIAKTLGDFFTECDSKQSHWLYIAQHWNPRAINRSIKRMVKLHTSGAVTIQNPAAYFTHLIKYRKKRRGL